MGTAILVRGTCRAMDPLSELEAFAIARSGPFAPQASRAEDEQGRPLLALAIHPAAEPVRAVDLGEGRIAVEGVTGTAGPGYHAHVTELLQSAAGALGITWEHVEDESGYFESQDRRALEEATRIWLATTVHEVLALHARGVRGLQMSLPEGTLFEHAGVLATPMGPRDLAWLERVAKAPGEGLDVFPWWNAGEGAETLRGAAIAAMWIDVRWRAPLIESERALVERVLGWLDRGQALAPELDWPWREQSELLERLGEDSLRATKVHLRASALPPGPVIGYRRQPVRVTLSGGWSIRVPGDFAERWEERGTWVGWDATRSVWLNSLEVQGSPGTDETLAALPDIEGEGELMGFERGEDAPERMRAVARFAEGEEDGVRLVQLRAHAALGPHAAFGTIVVAKDEDREWALETWSSLLHVDER